MNTIDYRARAIDAHSKLRGLGMQGGTLNESLDQALAELSDFRKAAGVLGTSGPEGLAAFFEIVRDGGTFDEATAVELAKAAIGHGRPVGAAVLESVVGARILRSAGGVAEPEPAQ